MTCDQFRDAVVEKLVDERDPAELLEMVAHAHDCDECMMWLRVGSEVAIRILSKDRATDLTALGRAAGHRALALLN